MNYKFYKNNVGEMIFDLSKANETLYHIKLKYKNKNGKYNTVFNQYNVKANMFVNGSNCRFQFTFSLKEKIPNYVMFNYIDVFYQNNNKKIVTYNTSEDMFVNNINNLLISFEINL